MSKSLGTQNSTINLDRRSEKQKIFTPVLKSTFNLPSAIMLEFCKKKEYRHHMSFIIIIPFHHHSSTRNKITSLSFLFASSPSLHFTIDSKTGKNLHSIRKLRNSIVINTFRAREWRRQHAYTFTLNFCLQHFSFLLLNFLHNGSFDITIEWSSQVAKVIIIKILETVTTMMSVCFVHINLPKKGERNDIF